MLSDLVPRIEFDVSRVLNEFCHLSVLYSDLMPSELANGILRNREYQDQHRQFRYDDVRLKLQETGPFSSATEWYKFAAGLMKRSAFGGFVSLSTHSKFVDLFQDLRQRHATGFDKIWKETWPRLESFRAKFELQWTPISQQVLSRLSDLARTQWYTERIHVQYVDCLYGGFAWNDCIAVTSTPDLDIQKKLLTHELSELITPQEVIAKALLRATLDPGITHTVVDMLAYFSVQEFLNMYDSAGREKKGLRPNPRYYPEADVLLPILELYAANPLIYSNFREVAEELVSKLPKSTTMEIPSA